MNGRALFRRVGAWKVVATIAVVQLASPFAPAAAVQPDPIKIAVFDFELEDASAGASVAGDSGADAEYMKAVSAAVRQEIEKSGRYRVVDVAGADADALRSHSLWKCNGCDAGIARALGAELSLVGLVRRITRTEYVVAFQLRDANSGAMLASRQSDLRMGANYSWSRGAAGLLRNGLLETSH